MQVQIEPSWQAALQYEFNADYFTALADFVRSEYVAQAVFPEPKNIFRAFNATPLSDVKVVILGQDPYHGEIAGQPQAQGLSFSVPENVPLPPSLQNIFKELQMDIGGELRTNGNLSDWAEQGVLLLNATLTVRAHQAGSHQKRGWERFTDAVIQAISDQREDVIFVLWGSYARQKKILIDTSKHYIIESPHPSPLSAYRGFFGSAPFSKINAYLDEHKQTPIVWK